MKSRIPLLAGLAGRLMKDKVHVPIVPSKKIESKNETKHEWSKRVQQKMKGKDARMNRGRNRNG